MERFRTDHAMAYNLYHGKPKVAHEPAKSQIHAYPLVLLLLLSLLFRLDVMGQDELTTNSRKARQHYLKAEQSLLLQDFDQASASLKNALEIDSRFIEAYLLQAELFTQTKHYPEAIQSYLDAIKIDSAFFCLPTACWVNCI